MIPKILHFIWLGKYEPPTVKFTIDTFAKVNPDFEINFIREEDARNAKNEDVRKTFEIINSPENNKYKSLYLNKGDCVNKSEVCFLTKFSDAIRFYLLNKYGGIYLDCDTFPVKPFDDKILSYDMFRTGRRQNTEPKLLADFSFVGHNPSCGYDSLDFMLLYNKKVSDKIRIINYDSFNPNKRPNNWPVLESKYLKLTLEYGKDFYQFDKNVDDNYVNFYNRDFKKTGHWWREYSKIKAATKT